MLRRLQSVRLTPYTLYTNPLAVEMDKKLLNASSPGDLLALTITHRGVMFVNNLVTAIDTLAVQNANASSPGRLATRSITKDERFMLLVHDLLTFAPRLDVPDIAKVVQAMKHLDFRHFPLFTAMTKRLIALLAAAPHLSEESLRDLISTGSALSWAGYGGSLGVFRPLAERIASELQKGNASMVLPSVKLFGSLPVFHSAVFAAAAQALRQGDLVQNLSSQDLAAVMLDGFARHKFVDEELVSVVVRTVTERVRRRHIRPSDALRVARSLSMLSRSDKNLIDQIASVLVIPALKTAAELREVLSVVRLEDLSSFARIYADTCSTGVGEFECCLFAYLEDQMVYQDKSVTEDAAIDFLSFLKFCPALAVSHADTLTLLARAVAKGTSWEKRKSEVFELWLSSRLVLRGNHGQLHFPALKKNFLRQCYREWLLRRGGVHSVWSHRLQQLLRSKGIQAEFEVHVPNSPFVIDALLPDNRALVIVETVGHQLTGFARFSVEYLQTRGFSVVPISRDWLRSTERSHAVLEHLERCARVAK